MTEKRDHGGDIAKAVKIHGGRPADWIDLSTGINRTPYPADIISNSSFRELPGSEAKTHLLNAASNAYSTEWPLAALPGAQAAIQLLPSLLDPGLMRILGPTYNEFEAAFHGARWEVEQSRDMKELHGAKVAIVVNPNNPTGTVYKPAQLLALAQNVDLLVVDESFADASPLTSLLTHDMPKNTIVLRSFGKFFGLAGLRLGFAAGPLEIVNQMVNLAGPWCVSGPALEIGARALADSDWQSEMRAKLHVDAQRCDQIVSAAGWAPLGGTALFRLVKVHNALAAQNQLAKHQIWTRAFPYSKTWLRLGLPGPESEWHRLEDALSED